MTGVMQAVAASGFARSATLVQTTSDIASGWTTKSFTSQNFGAANAKRQIVVVFNGYRNGASTLSISSMTIGGVTGTKLAELSSSGGNCLTSIWIAAVPTGTSGTVAVTSGQTNDQTTLQIYSLIGYSATPQDTKTLAANANPASVTINVAAAGFVVAGDAINQSGTQTWTNLTKDFDFSSTIDQGGASAFFAAANATQSISCSHSGGQTQHSLTAVSFKPG